MFKNILRIAVQVRTRGRPALLGFDDAYDGLTFLLDEYKTSKMCPCGHDELKTTGYRFRAHKSDGAACDRDALASLNMVSCALCALAGRTRPEHLCRSKCMRCE